MKGKYNKVSKLEHRESSRILLNKFYRRSEGLDYAEFNTEERDRLTSIRENDPNYHTLSEKSSKPW